MIKILYQNGRYAPAFFCDQCNEPIRDAGLAMELVPATALVKDGDIALARHVHKGECIDRYEAQHGDCGTTELTTHLLRLIVNCGLTLDELKKRDWMKDVEEF